MKELVDKKLKIETECPVCGGNGLLDKTDPCPGCGGSGVYLRTLSPAELAKENLKALAVLEKVKEYLKGKVDGHLVGIRNLIQNLESDVSQEERSK